MGANSRGDEERKFARACLHWVGMAKCRPWKIFCTLQQKGNPSSCVHVGFNTTGKVIDWMMQEEDTRLRETLSPRGYKKKQ